MLRKTSSSLPSSTENWVLRQLRRLISSATAGAMTLPPEGSTLTTMVPFSSFRISVPATLAKLMKALFASSALTLSRDSVTASYKEDLRRSSEGDPFATILPLAMIMALVQTASTSSRMCVERIMHLFSAMSVIMRLTSNFWFGSSPSVGSSRIRTGGSGRIACAKQTRCL